MRRTMRFNTGWEFQLKKGDAFTPITLPHTIRLEKLDEYRCYHSVVCYRKRFSLSVSAQEQVFLEFGGAMIVADIYLNGKKLLRHKGGYIPFVLDLSGKLLAENELLVKLDNREKPFIPPGRPEKQLDFLYYSGLYRNVTLTVTDEVFITNPVFAEKIGGGGLAITTTDIGAACAEVCVQTQLQNRSGALQDIELELCISRNGEALYTQRQVLQLADEITYTQTFSIASPALWAPDTPNLYHCTARILRGGVVTDEVTERFGIRQAVCKNDGFYLNGEKLYLFGTNRHQQFPYLGIAADDNAQYRDAYLLKQMGANCIRLSHYAHPSAFYDACDELGIILINQVPGWQYCRYGQFRRLSERNVQIMMRRDRNHASMIFMETSLNETVYTKPGATDAFYRKLNALCKAEGQILTYGSPFGRKNYHAVDYDMISANWDEKTKNRPSTDFPGRKSLIPEYGDFEFGGHHSSSRADYTEGEQALQLQAWNFQWSLNQNLKNPDSLGCLTWEGIDHVRGYDPHAPISKSGMLDIFRHPKPVYYLYQSQRRDLPILSPAILQYIGQQTVTVYSSCEMVRVYDSQGKLLREQPHDSGADSDYVMREADAGESVLYWTKNGDYLKSSKKNGALARHAVHCFQDGGNCRHMAHPPFTFTELPPCEGLRFVGVINGREVCETTLLRCEAPETLSVEVMDCTRPLRANGTDFVFVHIKARDKNGTVDFGCQGSVTLEILGGRAVYSPCMPLRGGIASFLVQAEPGAACVQLLATCGALRSEPVQIPCENL